MIIQILVYLFILIAKMIEVSLATTRIMLITRGERLYGALIGFVEVIIWVILVSTILKDITNDPVKVIFYALGFSLGNYFGSKFEEKLGFGTVRCEAIVLEHHGTLLAEQLRSHGFAVTILEGSGMNFKRNVLIMHVKRKRIHEMTEIVKSLQENVVITINDIKPVYGGYGTFKK